MRLAAVSRIPNSESSGRSLRWLLAGMADAPPAVIAGIATDSRDVTRGDAFLACRGATHHGLDFLDQALDGGAVAVVWDSSTAAAPAAREGVTMVPVAGLADRLGDIANRWFDAPSARLRVSGVTGTNGKTTVAWLISQCMQMLGRPCAYLGTLGAGVASLDRRAVLTTPGCIELHETLAGFASGGAAFSAIEVSSHALHQRRVDGVRFDSALFTNLSRDHIDYHGDMRTYGDIKARFVTQRNVGHRIVLVDSAFGRQLAYRCVENIVAVSTRPECRIASMPHVHMQALAVHQHGSTVEVAGSWGDARFELPLAGDFNVANAALVMAQMLCWGVPLAEAGGALSRVRPPPGRMQRVDFDGEGAPLVYVDYAHTPAGLEAVLATLRDHCRGQLWCVFGCGGDRDRGKRGPMGEVVSRLADRAVVTNDNPRTEDPAAIIAAVLAEMGEGALAIEDRAGAISYAIGNACAEDVVLIAGKGHEDYQVIGDARLPFSDYQAALAALAARQPQGSSR